MLHVLHTRDDRWFHSNWIRRRRRRRWTTNRSEVEPQTVWMALCTYKTYNNELNSLIYWFARQNVHSLAGQGRRGAQESKSKKFNLYLTIRVFRFWCTIVTIQNDLLVENVKYFLFLTFYDDNAINISKILRILRAQIAFDGFFSRF